MGLVFSLLLLLAIANPLAAQALSAKGLSEPERNGLRSFLQRCSVCHLGVPPLYQTYAPPLYKDLITAKADDAVRKVILEGSPRMPGFQYVLKPADVDNIIAYLKSVPKEAVMLAPPPQSKSQEEGK